MSSTDIPAEVKDFIFQYIDSVEQLEILLLMFASAPKAWTSDEISDYLRSNRNSIEKRLSLLEAQKLLVESPELVQSKKAYILGEEKTQKIVALLSEIYKVHKYGVLEMIFSPMKKSRDFAEAFRITIPKDDKGDRNG